jgi:hypothetical protein
MKTVKFNEDEVELLIALYEDELIEAGSYIEKLQLTLSKLKNKAEVKAESVKTGKKRGRKPKVQLLAIPPAPEKKKRGRKKKIQGDSLIESITAVAKKNVKKRRTRKHKKSVTPKSTLRKPAIIETPVIAE